MSKYPSTLRWANSLARREANELLKAITDFANLGDTADDLRFFRKRWPHFLPSSLCDPAERNMKSYEGHVFQNFRRGVRNLWTGEDRGPHLALSLLGVHYGGLSYVIDPTHEIAHVDFGWDWSTGELLYASNVEFHQALFLLFGRRRLAKVCPQCKGCFLAKRGTQLYCSTDCSEIAEREWKREWWRKNGEAWRAKRTRASEERKQPKKRRATTASGYLM
jgi:hypothetical protein